MAPTSSTGAGCRWQPSTMSLIFIMLAYSTQLTFATLTDSKSHLVKETTVIMIENDGSTPITHHLVDCDERNGHSRLSHIVAKLADEQMPVSKTDDGNWWYINLSSKPIEPGVKVPLMVTKVYTHLELVPNHDVYLIPYSSIQYQVRIIKQGRPQKIKVPSDRYYLVVDDKDLVDLDESTSTAYAMDTEGSTKLRFVDKSVISDEDFIQPESNIHIVQPSYLTMQINPGNSWDLRKFTDYIVEIKIFDPKQHQIYPSENLNIQLTSGNELVITNSTSNGTHHSIHTLNTGPSKLVARLLGTTSNYLPQQLDIELVQEVHIHEPLEIRPTAVVLPWIPDLKPFYEISIFAAGGTGSYVWSTNNSALTDITYGSDDTSVAKVLTKGQGISFVQCTDTKSSVFLRHSMIVISRIVDIAILPAITETEVGGDILLPVAVYANRTALLELHLPSEEMDSDLVLFHDCSKIKFNVEIVEKTRFSHDPTEVTPNVRPKSCASLKFTCNQPGSSRVWISYVDPTDTTAAPIKTTTVIACYKPLTPVYPGDTGVLALHTSIEIAFEGGPRPFGSRLDDHYTHLEPNNNPVLSLEPVIDRYRYNRDLHVFKVSCNQYGEAVLTLSVGNQPSATLPNPASSRASVTIVCAKPDFIQLRPRLKESCPLNELASLTETLVPISHVAPTDFELIVYDESKRQFLNISSFSINWTLNGHGRINSRQIEEVNAVAGYRRVTRNYVNVQPIGREGLGRLRAELHAYKGHNIYQGQTLDLSTNLDIQFVEYAKITPNKTIVYNHRKNVVVLSIIKGSGYFSVESLQGAKNANVTYVSVLGNHRINIVPLSIGDFMVRLEDQCLESGLGTPILSEVSIVSESDFNRESQKPGRSMKFCREIDEAIFCLYLSIDPFKAQQTSTTTRPAQPTIVPVTIDKPKPQVIPQQRPLIEEPPTPPPKISFAPINHQVEEKKISLWQQISAFLLMMIVTAAAVALGIRWDQTRRRAQMTTSFDSRVLRNSPARVIENHSFSPSTSRGPASSTPRARPLYTERFSTTLLAD